MIDVTKEVIQIGGDNLPMVTKKIYIQLLNEGTISYRPTISEEISENVFRVMPTEDYDPEDETWEFLPGDIVICRPEVKSGPEGKETVLVARQKYEPGKLR